jgi:intracellular septation protein A
MSVIGLLSTVGPLTHNAGMNRDVSWQRIMVAILIGCAVFASGKLAYGFQISKDDIIGIAISLAVVFGLAALILVFRDKVTLKPNMSAEERHAAITKSSKRLHRGWATALFIMALVALPVHAFGLKDEPFWQRLLFFGLAALIVINFLWSRRDSNHGGLRDEESKSGATDDAD